MRVFRILPKIEIRRLDEKILSRPLLGVSRYWFGRLIYVYVMRYTIVLDFRKNWLADMSKTERQERNG